MPFIGIESYGEVRQKILNMFLDIILFKMHCNSMRRFKWLNNEALIFSLKL
jgi:hypothetical protein